MPRSTRRQLPAALSSGDLAGMSMLDRLDVVPGLAMRSPRGCAIA